MSSVHSHQAYCKVHSDTWRSVSMFSLRGKCGDRERCLNHTVGLSAVICVEVGFG